MSIINRRMVLWPLESNNFKTSEIFLQPQRVNSLDFTERWGVKVQCSC